jgi:ABC-type Fe3+/spermidine/putrescine transport system ATPase subunit
MIELRDIAFQVGDFILNVNHSFALNKLHVVLGPSGSGKTVVLEMIAGLIPPASGEIVLNSENINKRLPEERQMGYLPQDNTLFPHLTVGENIIYGLRAQGRLVDEAATQQVCDQLKVSHLFERSVGRLSGGEVQRVALARSIVAGNKILLLDEPTSSLNSVLKTELCHLLLSIQKEFELTIIMVTHDMESAYMLGDTITFMINGAIEQSSLNTLAGISPSNIRVAEFMGFRNIFHGVLEKQGEAYFINAPELGNAVQSKHESALKFASGDEVIIGVSPNDVRIIIRGKEEDRAPDNQLECRIVKTYNKGATLNIHMVPKGTSVVLESDFPMAKRYKIRFEEGDEISVVLEATRLFIWPKA